MASSVARYPHSSAAWVPTRLLIPGTRPTTLALPTRLGAPEWGEAFASRVAWAANSNVQVAELRLNPPQLGHIGVHIAIHNNKADIAIATPHAEVLASIEAALPRLRELFGESGVTLGDVEVSQHSPGETPDRDRDSHPRAKFLAAHEMTGETEMPLKPCTSGSDRPLRLARQGCPSRSAPTRCREWAMADALMALGTYSRDIPGAIATVGGYGFA